MNKCFFKKYQKSEMTNQVDFPHRRGLDKRTNAERSTKLAVKSLRLFGFKLIFWKGGGGGVYFEETLFRNRVFHEGTF